MSKKLLALITCCLLAVATHATATHNENYVASNLSTPGKILTFQKAPNAWLSFQNFLITTVYGVSDIAYVRRMYVDCLITKNDLRNSDTDYMPLNAKIVGFQLDGYYNKQYSNEMSIQCWMKTTTQTAIEHTGVRDGYLHNNYRSHLTDDWLVRDSIKCVFPENATEQNPLPLFDINFNPSKSVVFNGDNLLLSYWYWGGKDMNKLSYLCSPAETQIATFFRSGNYGYGGPATGGTSAEVDDMVTAESYQLPAFRWKYYTNDITIVVNLLDPNGNPIAQDDITADQPDGRPLLYIYDETAKQIVQVQGTSPNAEGFFAVTPGASVVVKNVDYTHQYRIIAKSVTCGQDEVLASFGSIDNDIDLTFTLQQEKAIVVYGDVTGDGLVDIADVNAVINVMLGKWTAADCANDPDLTGDGKVDIADVNASINYMLGKNQE